MKKYFILFVVSIVIVFSSCKKDVPGYTDGNESFDAQLPDTLITTAAKAHFLLFSNPDVISFYPGDSSHNYDYRDRTYAEGGRINFKFTSSVTTTADTIDVMLSTDYSGNNDSASIVDAHWKKITNLFIFPTGTATSPAVNLYQDITDSTILGQPFYVAFKYVNRQPKTITWSIKDVGMYNMFTNGTPSSTMIKSTNIRSGGYSAVSIYAPKKLLWKIPTTSSGSLTLANSSSGGYANGTEAWLISGVQKASVSPDQPIVIKNITQSPLKSYDYQYTKPGTYKATFVASYNRLNYEKTFVKQITVIVQ